MNFNDTPGDLRLDVSNPLPWLIVILLALFLVIPLDSVRRNRSSGQAGNTFVITVADDRQESNLFRFLMKGIALLIFGFICGVMVIVAGGLNQSAVAETTTPLRLNYPLIIEESKVITPVIVGVRPVLHRVKAGQTLYGIAKLYNTSVQALKAANTITNGNIILPNQVLIVPKGLMTFDGRALIVKPGETAEQIASENNIPLEHLLSYNGLTYSGDLKTGDPLLIPYQSAFRL